MKAGTSRNRTPRLIPTARRWPTTLAAALCALWLVSDAQAGKGQKPKRRRSLATFGADYAKAPSYQYGSLDAPSCLAELHRRKVSYQPVAEARGVLAPVRIPDGVGGVLFRTALPRSKGRQSPWEVFDCRLVLALHDFSKILVAHRIDEVIMFSAWRPPGKKWPEGKLARRHPGALAIDMYRFRQRVDLPAPPAVAAKETETPPADEAKDEPKDEPKDEGAKEAPATKATEPPASKATKAKTEPAPPPPHRYEWLDVKDDFQGKIGQPTCQGTPAGPKPASPKTVAIRALMCEAAAARIFTSMLSPNYDKPHFNHFHFEVTPGVKWRLVR
ncbi:MAG: hypothetical protein JRI68_15170 [Deltaproteobacteria bacterium]|nr:hypothetical protein [Deltaproteobacteria bacterium]